MIIVKRMGRQNQCHRYPGNGRQIWWHVRSQGHRFRVRHVDLRRIQALPDQGIPAAQGRRSISNSAGTIRRNLAKINYRIHTDAIKENLIPPELSAQQINLIYASEADVLNMALFGMTAKQWRDSHPGRERQYPRRCGCVAARVPVQSGEPERPVHPGEDAAGGTAPQVEPDRDSTDETVDSTIPESSDLKREDK